MLLCHYFVDNIFTFKLRAVFSRKTKVISVCFFLLPSVIGFKNLHIKCHEQKRKGNKHHCAFYNRMAVRKKSNLFSTSGCFPTSANKKESMAAFVS